MAHGNKGAKTMDDFEMLLQQIVEQCLELNADPAAMAAHLREIAEAIEADIEAGAYAE